MRQKWITSTTCTRSLVYLTKFTKPCRFSIPTKTADAQHLTRAFKNNAVMDVQLQVRHGSALPMKLITWLVTDQEVGDPVRRRPLFQVLGLEMKDFLLAATERFRSVVTEGKFHMAQAFNPTKWKVAGIIEGVYQADGTSQVD